MTNKLQTVEFSDQYGSIDKVINRWINENPEKLVVDIKYQVYCDPEGLIHESALLLYIENC